MQGIVGRAWATLQHVIVFYDDIKWLSMHKMITDSICTNLPHMTAIEQFIMHMHTAWSLIEVWASLCCSLSSLSSYHTIYYFAPVGTQLYCSLASLSGHPIWCRAAGHCCSIASLSMPSLSSCIVSLSSMPHSTPCCNLATPSRAASAVNRSPWQAFMFSNAHLMVLLVPLLPLVHRLLRRNRLSIIR